jgi:hypothetical protein
MQAADIPSKFPIPFANSALPGANVRPIPINPPAQAGAASLTQGFPPLNFTPVAAGGIPPFGQDMNGLLQQITAWLRWHESGAPVGYDATFATSIGGYPKGSLLPSATFHVWYESLIDNNTDDPNAGSANWRVAYSPWSAQYWTATGSANAQTLTLSPAPITLAQLVGIPLNFLSQGTNTGPVTLNVNALGNINLTQANGTLLGLGAMVAGGAYTCVLTTFGSSGLRFLVTSQINSYSDPSNVALALTSSPTSPLGANLLLAGNGATVPNKYIRARNGVLEFVNHAYTGVIASIDNAGNFGATGNISTPGVMSAAGNITSTGGAVRASVGAFGSSDPNIATILGDFGITTAGPINDGYSFQRLPDGYILQTFNGSTITGTDVITFPNAFPRACFQVLVHEAHPQGWDQGGGVLSPTVFGTQQLSGTNFALYTIRLNVGTGQWEYAGGVAYRYLALGY